MSAPVYDHPEQPSAAAARETAVWFLAEVAARRLDPVESVEAVFDEVRIVVRPASLPVWRTWESLIDANATAFVSVLDTATMHGRWRDVPVVIVGIRRHEWWPE